jgi:hypothetical protein
VVEGADINCRNNDSSGGSRSIPRARPNEIVAMKRSFAACGNLPAMLGARLKRKECKTMSLDTQAYMTFASPKH